MKVDLSVLVVCHVVVFPPPLEVLVVKGCCELLRVSAVLGILGTPADTLGAADGAGTWVWEDTRGRHSRTGSCGRALAGGGSGDGSALLRWRVEAMGPAVRCLPFPVRVDARAAD